MSQQQKLKNDAFDGLTEPNIYALPQTYTNINQIVAGHVYDSFPLKFENFYLRFYLEDKIQNIKLWMDYPPDAKIPVYGDKAYVKVLRLPKNVQLTFKNNEMFAKTKESHKKPNEKLIDFNENNKSEMVTTIPIDNFNSGNLNIEINNKNKKTYDEKLNKSSNNIFEMDQEKINSNGNGNGNGYNLDNLDVNKIGEVLQDNSPGFEFVNTNTNRNGNNSNLNINKNSSKNEELFDIFSSESSKSVNSITGNQQTSTESPKKNNNSTNNTLFGLSDLNWGASTDNTVTTQQSQPVVDFSNSSKSNYAIDNIPNNLDEDDIKDRVEIIVKKWAFGVNEKKNLRFILGTFYEVWTSEPMWKEISMESLIHDQSSVKTYYKKALGQTHPDKNSNKDYKTRYTADLLYNILTQAKSELPK